jgi:diguanylate cyclase (GGDEF)-like protein
VSLSDAGAAVANPPATDEHAWARLVQALPDAAWLVALPSLRVRAANAAACALHGLDAAALAACAADQLLATPEDLCYWEEARRAAAAGRAIEALQSATLLLTADGRTLHVRRSIRPLGDVDGGGAAATLCLVTVQDRSDTHEAEARHADTLAELQATLEATADGILVTGLDGSIRGFNRRFAELWGLPPELLDTRHDDAVHDWMRRSVKDAPGYARRLLALQDATLMSATDRLELHAGQVLERVARPLWSRGRPLGRVYSFRDLTAQLKADERIHALARSDSLTGLPNRGHMAALIERGAQAIEHAGDGFALLLVDLDRFSRINDSLGQALGNGVLRDVAQRLRECLRQGDEIARVGGDQFALLLRHADAAAAEAAAARVLDVVAQPWQAEGEPFSLTCSVGIALCPAHGRCADELLAHAESAMRRAKRAGSNGLRFHQQHAEADLRSHLQLDHAMRQALASGRFRLHYQPQVAFDDGRIVGAEALIRWRDPSLGEVPPGRFIGVAEDTGFIIAIGDWVLSTAARQAAEWHRAGLEVPVSVNVSALQFRQPQFLDRVDAVLREQALPPSLLALELTESILLHEADDALQRLQALAALGVRLSIDDFGTGYSSLAYLKQLPVGQLKVDRSFVRGLPYDDRDAGIVRATVQMAHALGMGVVAEGVETEPQRKFLQEAGCQAFQGFLFAPALDALSFVRRLGPPAAATAAAAAAAPATSARRPLASVHRLAPR